HRHYDPTTARYLTPDPLGLTPAPNHTTYVHNPHTWTDPLGLAPEECSGGAPRGYPSQPAFGGETGGPWKDPYHPDEVQRRIDAGQRAWQQIPREVHNTVNGIESGRVTQRINSNGPDWFNANGRTNSPWYNATIFTGVGSPTTLTRVLVRSDGVVGYVLGHNYNNVIEYGYARLPGQYVPRPE
ncbi:RHS repeat-associated core domain-containing protein, partial [Kitasatospora sp. LaBMicrA B282]|uniref:RHS repeat-associated core domain-containing protein n=1 Tax=Kitasatospora sp. LaBMicrA B282 TaxID=3420949 RepID=UPI003D0A4E7D